MVYLCLSQKVKQVLHFQLIFFKQEKPWSVCLTAQESRACPTTLGGSHVEPKAGSEKPWWMQWDKSDRWREEKKRIFDNISPSAEKEMTNGFHLKMAARFPFARFPVGPNLWGCPYSSHGFRLFLCFCSSFSLTPVNMLKG